MRNYSQEHARRQQSKHRMGFEVDRQSYESLTREQRETLSKQVRDLINRFFEKIKMQTNDDNR